MTLAGKHTSGLALEVTKDCSPVVTYVVVLSQNHFGGAIQVTVVFLLSGN